VSSEREKALAALKRIPELQRKLDEQQRLIRELQHSLEHEAYEYRRWNQRADRFRGSCGYCGRQFIPGEEIFEYLDDNGQVVSRYHAYAEECRRAAERDPAARMRYT
jgi:hypothetical protein